MTSLLKELGWPTVNQLVTECDISRMHSLLNSPHAPASLCEEIVYRGEISGRETRAVEAGALQLPRVRAEHWQTIFQLPSHQTVELSAVSGHGCPDGCWMPEGGEKVDNGIFAALLDVLESF